ERDESTVALPSELSRLLNDPRNEMTEKMTQTAKYRLLRLCCFAIWGGMLVVGLWPFNFFPRNKVEWLGNKNGICFDWDGQVYSADRLTGWEMESGTPQMSSLSIDRKSTRLNSSHGSISYAV